MIEAPLECRERLPGNTVIIIKKQLGWYHVFSFLENTWFFCIERMIFLEIIKKNSKIYLICGKARHGKDTIAAMIDEFYLEQGKSVLNLQFSSYIKEYAKKISNWDGSEETKPRELLQQLGTSIIRERIDELFFVKRMIRDLQVYHYFFDVLTISDSRAKVEVDSVREAFDTVVVIHVVRPNFDNGLTLEQQKHFTEVDLDDYSHYDYEIINDGTLEDLKNKVIDIVRKEDEK